MAVGGLSEGVSVAASPRDEIQRRAAGISSCSTSGNASEAVCNFGTRLLVLRSDCVLLGDSHSVVCIFADCALCLLATLRMGCCGEIHVCRIIEQMKVILVMV